MATLIEEVAAGIIDSSNAVMSVNTVVNVLLSYSLKFLWGMINTFQFVVFFSEWKKT